MSSFEDAIWDHLVDYYDADRMDFRAPTPPKHARRPLAAACGAVLAATVVALVLLVSGSTSPPPAYALTAVGDGSYTVSLRDLSTGIPALNAKLARLGIHVTAVPIRPGCKASSFSPVQAGPGSLRQTVTISSHSIPSGYHGYIAAERLANGEIGLAQGASAKPIPPCFPTATGHGIPGP